MITTHVLDISAGRPAEGILVILEQSSAAGWTERRQFAGAYSAAAIITGGAVT